jgi:hypothetical protein
MALFRFLNRGPVAVACFFHFRMGGVHITLTWPVMAPYGEGAPPFLAPPRTPNVMSINGSISYALLKLRKMWQCDHIYLIFLLYIYIPFYKREIWCLANLPPRTCPPLYLVQSLDTVSSRRPQGAPTRKESRRHASLPLQKKARDEYL